MRIYAAMSTRCRGSSLISGRLHRGIGLMHSILHDSESHHDSKVRSAHVLHAHPERLHALHAHPAACIAACLARPCTPTPQRACLARPPRACTATLSGFILGRRRREGSEQSEHAASGGRSLGAIPAMTARGRLEVPCDGLSLCKVGLYGVGHEVGGVKSAGSGQGLSGSADNAAGRGRCPPVIIPLVRDTGAASATASVATARHPNRAAGSHVTRLHITARLTWNGLGVR